MFTVKSIELRYFIFFLLIIFFFSNNKSKSSVKEYFITCKPNDFKKIYDNPSKDIYIPITFTYNDSTWSNTFMRIRGDGTRYLPKKSLKIKFKGDNFIDNQDKINLNAEYEDPSYIHQYLASRLYNETGYPCFKAEHIRVYLNGKYLGLYLQIENVDEHFLKARGYDTKGNMYKARSDGSSMSVFDSVYVLWTKETNDSLHREDLRKLIDDINAVPDSVYYDFVKKTFDYDKMVTLIAMNLILSNASTYYHNYFLYDDIRNSKKWTVFPWDMDKTFNTYNAGWPYTWSSAWSHPDNPMLERALLCDTIFSDIKSKLAELNNTIFNSEHLFPIIDSLVNVLEISIQEDKTDNIEDSLETWRDWIGWTKTFITKRYNVLLEQFETYPKSFRVDRTKYSFVGDVVLRWHPSSTPNGEPVKYSLHYYTKPNVNLEEATHIYDITDTTYVLKNVPPGKYFWKIEAYNSVYSTEGFDKYNIFEVKTGTTLPCTIDKDMTLSKDKSPYIINCSVEVNPVVKLEIKEGVELVFKDFYNLDVYGQIVAQGTKEEPIILRPDASIKKWRVLYISKPTGVCKLKNVKLINGIFKGYDGNFELENVTAEIKDTSILDDCFYFENSSFTIDSGYINANKISEAVIAFKCQNITTKNLIIENTADAIEYVECTDGIMNNNTILNSSDDCIDMNGSKNITISNNTLMNAFDKGISIGNDGHGISFQITIRNNIIYDCNTGINVKSGSSVNFINNTLYNNKTGIGGYEKVPNSGGATINVVNTIFSQSDIPITKDDKSTINISYSLCDSQQLSGDNNIMANPEFIDKDNLDFRLTKDSPCIDAGDPNSDLDPDSTRADIGALYYDQKPPMIVINEINYHSSPNFDTDDWVEFYNADNYNVDISNWIFKDSDDMHSFAFPEGTILKPDNYIVLCKDLKKFGALFPNVMNSIGNMNFGLSGSGELIRLYDNNENIIDSLTYDDKKPWEEKADGKGASLELINPYYDNTIATNWKASIIHGTPGRRNDYYQKTDTTNGNDSNNVIITDFLLYPNPAKNSISLLISTDEVYNFDFEVFDFLSDKMPIRFNVDDFSGNEETKIITFNTSNLLNGFYFLRLKHNNNFRTLPFVILR